MTANHGKKHFWYQSIPFDAQCVTQAIEAGAEVIVVEANDRERARALGRVRVLSTEGDLRWARDVRRLEIVAGGDQPRATGPVANVIESRDWTIIPLENLIAQPGRQGLLIQTVTDADQTDLALTVMESGADGVLLVCNDPAVIRAVGQRVQAIAAPRFVLTEARIETLEALGLGDRCCIDTTSLLAAGEGLLVGDRADAQFLVHNEHVEAPHVRPRPFRINAGAVHAYLRQPGDHVGYLSELRGGSTVVVVRPDGRSRIVSVGRNKIERRPLIRVTAVTDEGKEVSLILQNAETIRLTTPDGQAVSIVDLRPGDPVLAHVTEVCGRHLGAAVRETIEER